MTGVQTCALPIFRICDVSVLERSSTRGRKRVVQDALEGKVCGDSTCRVHFFALILAGYREDPCSVLPFNHLLTSESMETQFERSKECSRLPENAGTLASVLFSVLCSGCLFDSEMLRRLTSAFCRARRGSDSRAKISASTLIVDERAQWVAVRLRG